jgi:hypothetical protein
MLSRTYGIEKEADIYYTILKKSLDFYKASMQSYKGVETHASQFVGQVQEICGNGLDSCNESPIAPSSDGI